MVSSTDGYTKTEANEVCRRACVSNGRDAHQAVHAALGAQVAVRVLAAHLERGGLDPRLLALLLVEELHVEAVALAPAVVHAEEHLGPVLAFGAAGAGVHGHQGVAEVVGALEHVLELQRLQLAPDPLDLRGDLLQHPFILLHLEEVEHLVGVGAAGGEGEPGRGPHLDLVRFVDQLARGGPVVPEGGVAHPRLELIQLFLLGRDVKETPLTHRVGRGERGGSSADRRSLPVIPVWANEKSRPSRTAQARDFAPQI
jgi:hypothetical protein